MLYSIRGELIHLDTSFAVIEAAGVGYKLSVSEGTRSRLAGIYGKEKAKNVFLLTHMAVREDGIELYGFFSSEELECFRLLISVSGIGPKVAMSVLSTLSPEKLALSIAGEDIKAISGCPGVGKKTAARIILELKDKLKAGTSAENAGIVTDVSAAAAGTGSNADAAVEALMVLGFSKQQAAAALSGLDCSQPPEDIIRAALKKLNRI
ncbi:MAG: Holliday junction branch migration protein RuvA [Clostridia bacterium]|nr:Holliday junction branch migration protein RuvA [Clostridia bacterium]